jgi:hypothetical protein
LTSETTASRHHNGKMRGFDFHEQGKNESSFGQTNEDIGQKRLFFNLA